VKTAHQTQGSKCKGEGQRKLRMEEKGKGKRVAREAIRKIKESHEDE
jgi:hypothetical protein